MRSDSSDAIFLLKLSSSKSCGFLKVIEGGNPKFPSCQQYYLCLFLCLVQLQVWITEVNILVGTGMFTAR